MNADTVFGDGINRPLLNVLCSLGIKNKRILSLGCGSAALEEILEKKYACEVFGVDYSKDAIASAKKRIGRAFVADLEKNNIKSLLCGEKFDIILLADILEHVWCVQDVLESCRNFMHESSIIVASIPNVANWSVRLKLLFGNFDYEGAGILDRTHVHFYTLKTARQLILRCRYKIMSVKYSASFVNIVYGALKQPQQSQDLTGAELFQKARKKSWFRKFLKSCVESVDKLVTGLFPNLLAYQFIIIARKN